MNPISGGDLDRRIDIEALVTTRDPETGAALQSWVLDHQRVPAQVRESATASLGGAGTTVAAVARPMKIRMRWRTLDRASHRIVYDGRVLRILGLAELGRREGLEAVVEEWSHE